jgi:hypothetical protein
MDSGVPLDPLGATCAADSACGSGSCVDGVCCDSACDSGCEACVASVTGESDGQCAPVPAGADPDDECAAGPCGAGFCDGGGACQTANAGTLCRVSAGDCDVAETRDGVAPVCPGDDFAAAGTLCRDASNACDAQDFCSGGSADCVDTFEGAVIGDCAPYRCVATAPMCGSSCATTADCATGAACMAGACVPARRVFVTSTLHRPHFGGLAGGDAICQARAQAANVPGRFRAWLSDGSTNAAQRLEHFNGPYYRFYNGTPETVADNWADLTDGSLDLVMAITEYGQVRNGSQGAGIEGDRAWTGTSASGVATANHCDGWTTISSAFIGTVGTNGGNTGNWTAADLLLCQYQARLYCIEQNPLQPD